MRSVACNAKATSKEQRNTAMILRQGSSVYGKENGLNTKLWNLHRESWEN